MVQAPYRTERWQMLKYWLDFVATLYASIVADLEKRNPLRLNLDGDPGMNVGHWIYIIIGFVVLFAVLVALYPTLFSNASAFGNSTGAIGKVVVVLLPILLAVTVLILFVRNFLGGKKGY